MRICIEVNADSVLQDDAFYRDSINIQTMARANLLKDKGRGRVTAAAA